MARSSCFLIAFLALTFTGQAMAGQSTSIKSWDHDAKLRFFSWMIINDAGKPCDRVVAVREAGYGVAATCTARLGRKSKTHHYRVDQIGLKPDFAERWTRAIGQ